MPCSDTMPYTPAAIPWAIKLTIENSPMPTPTWSLGNDLDTELDIAICMKDWPTFPNIKKIAIHPGEIPVKTDNKAKQAIKLMEATEYR
ncbi:hypothetical protein D3C85_1797180 [compost metagenome]